MGSKGSFTYAHFTIIIFNSVNTVVGNSVYRASYGYPTFNSTIGGEYTLPNGYDRNTMMGLCGFNGTKNANYFSFILAIGNMSSGSYGLSLSVTANAFDLIYTAYVYI